MTSKPSLTFPIFSFFFRLINFFFYSFNNRLNYSSFSIICQHHCCRQSAALRRHLIDSLLHHCMQLTSAHTADYWAGPSRPGGIKGGDPHAAGSWSVGIVEPFSVFLDEFSSFLSVAATTPHEFLITGDFNIHVDDSRDSLTSQFLYLLSFFNLNT